MQAPAFDLTGCLFYNPTTDSSPHGSAGLRTANKPEGRALHPRPIADNGTARPSPAFRLLGIGSINSSSHALTTGRSGRWSTVGLCA
jgi:hypothetical protein